MTFLDKQTTRDKRLLRLEREHDRLWHALHDAPVVPLEKPYQHDWLKTYVIEPSVLRRPDVEIFRRVLTVINRKVWSRGRDFLNRNGDPIVLRPRIIPPREWDRLGWPASHARLFSYGHWEDAAEICHRPHKRRLFIGYALRRQWWLCEDVQPRMITHQRVDLPEVRKRVAEIDAYFSHRAGRHRLAWLHGYSLRWRSRTAIADLRTVESTALSIES